MAQKTRNLWAIIEADAGNHQQFRRTCPSGGERNSHGGDARAKTERSGRPRAANQIMVKLFAKMRAILAMVEGLDDIQAAYSQRLEERVRDLETEVLRLRASAAGAAHVVARASGR